MREPNSTKSRAIAEFAAQRSHGDTVVYQNVSVALISAVLVLNGGGAVAFLALYGATYVQLVVGWKILFVASQSFFFAGALLALQAAHLLREGLREWANRWENIAIRNKRIYYWEIQGFDHAQDHLVRSRRSVIDSIIAFVFGTIISGGVLLLGPYAQ